MTFVILRLEEISLPQCPFHPYTLQEKQIAHGGTSPFPPCAVNRFAVRWAARSVPEIEAEYFRTNEVRMRYPVFRAQGMHIGSGIAEAACKTVVSTRAKRSGMRWTPAGLDAVLALRTAVLNRSYEDFWQSRSHRCA